MFFLLKRYQAEEQWRANFEGPQEEIVDVWEVVISPRHEGGAAVEPPRWEGLGVRDQKQCSTASYYVGTRGEVALPVGEQGKTTGGKARIDPCRCSLFRSCLTVDSR